MKHWKTHIPAGVQDFLPDEYYNKLKIEQRIRDIFDSWTYLEVEPPAFEYFDVFSEDKPSIRQEQIFKFFELGSRILVLRPDFTMPIARLAATKLKGMALPLRLSYMGNIYRYAREQSGKQREIAQAGIELMGIKGPEADAEVIAIAIESIDSLGLDTFQIDIGQVEFYKGFIENCNLDFKNSQRLTDLIESKDMLALEMFLNELDMADNLKQLFMKLPLLYGDIDML
ncbi:MAG: ATP phosphoribosyltransferase regulatory subunit, partial [Clostridiales bacterium]|nr:ATP phosphoribosyltransferase regulatory subunit [Clostridiales bacterium]